MKYYELTKYPNIFKNTYWGLFKGNKDDLDVIVNNRNKFKKDYNIKQTTKMTQNVRLDLNTTFYRMPNNKYDIIDFKRNNHYWKSYHTFIDHLEIYKTSDNKLVVLSSPYKTLDDETKINVFKENGWNLIYDLYDKDALTFCKVYG
jgi:hypothetical protein